jgi:hypothetical protein
MLNCKESSIIHPIRIKHVKGLGARLAYKGNRIRFTPYRGVGNKANSYGRKILLSPS